jgi:hypothetical protein
MPELLKVDGLSAGYGEAVVLTPKLLLDSLLGVAR